DDAAAAGRSTRGRRIAEGGVRSRGARALSLLQLRRRDADPMKPSDIRITVRRLDPSEAELWVTAPEPIAGRFMGPRCRYAGTVEVAHYLRPLPPGTAAPLNSQRVIVPEPSLWEPTTPFVYTGVFQAGDARLTLPYGL